MTSPLMMRRRAMGKGFSPKDIAGLVRWFDASEITGLVNGDPVAQWNDQSSLTVHATQATALARPTYRTGVSGIGGKPAVQFDGVDDFMDAGTRPDTASTMFVVTRDLVSGADDVIVIAARVNLFVEPAIANTLQFNDSGVAVRASVTDASLFGAMSNVIAGRCTGGGGAVWELFTNGTLRSSIAAAQASTTAAIRLGANAGATPGLFLSGLLGDTIIYGRALTDAENSQVARYLGTKYGITVA